MFFYLIVFRNFLLSIKETLQTNLPGFILLYFLFSSSLFATNATWTSATAGNWNDGTRWSTNPTFPNAIDDTANFLNAITASRIITLNQNITIGTAIFNNTSVRNYTISGANTLTFDVSAGSALIDIQSTNTGVHIISSNVALNDNLSVTHAAATNFTISGGISGSVTLSSTNSSSGNFTVSGSISGAGMNLVKNGTGSGSFVLSNANTYGGSTTINQGNLTYNANGCIPSTSAVTVGNGVDAATLIMAATMTQANGFAVTVNPNGTINQNNSVSTFVTNLNGSGNIVIGATNTNLFDIRGIGTTFSGSISGGLASASTSPTSNNRINKADPTTLVLSGTSTYVSRTFIENGIIDATSNGALGAAGASSAVYVRATGTSGALNLDNNITLPKTIFLNGSGFSGNGALHNVTGNNTITGNVQIGWTGAPEVASTATIQIEPLTSLNISGIVQGSSDLLKTGTGTLTYSGAGANTHSGTTTINAGTLALNKTGVNAIAGDVVINSGGTLQFLQSDQILNSADVTLSGGIFNMGGNAETIGSLEFISSASSLIQGGALLTLSHNAAAPIAALTMGDGTTISGLIAFSSTGVVAYTGTTTRATVTGSGNTFALGTPAHTFNISNGTDTIDMDIGSSITGSGALTFAGPGTLQLSGTVANTHTGTLTINGGEVILNKTGVNALGGNVTINSGGTLTQSSANQIIDTSTVTINSGGTFNMPFTETIGRLVYNGGVFNQGATLTLANASALSMGNGVTISGDLVINPGGTVSYNGTTTRATISGNVDLGNIIHSFNIANGTDTTDMIITGTVSGSGAGILRAGAGLLELAGTTNNTFTGLLTAGAGQVLLNKTPGINAIGGDVLLNDTSGTLILGGNDQIPDTSIITLSSGNFDMNGHSDTIGELIFNAGVVSQGGGVLSLASNSTALSMQNNSTLSGPVAITGGGSIVFINPSTATATISGPLDLGSSASPITFNIADGTAATDMIISSVISGTGNGITKDGAGLLQFSGVSSNTYSGPTTINAGTLSLNKTPGVNAIPGDITLNGGTLILANTNQISDSSIITMPAASTGTFDLAGFNETIGELIFNGGTLTQGAGILSLASNITALSMQNTTINGNIAITNGGEIVFDETNNGTATINGNLNLGGLPITFDIGIGSANIDMQINGIISNGALIKTDGGTLVLTGANTYGGGTTINAGVLQGNTTSLQGNIVDNFPSTLVFDQSFTGTFAGNISGNGILIKENTGELILTTVNSAGPVTVSAGELLVNSPGSLSGGGILTVNFGAVLGGTGLVGKSCNIDGTLAPGNSIGTINFVGNQTMGATSTLEIELDPSTSDFVNITGSLTMNNGSTLSIIETPGMYSPFTTYHIAHASGGVFNTFTNLTSSLPLLFQNVFYDTNDIFLTISFVKFSDIFTKGNAAQVAACLDELPHPNGSDLDLVIDDIAMLSNLNDIEKALLQLQPSAFTSLALVQENTSLALRNTIFDRIESLHDCEFPDNKTAFWVSAFGIHTSLQGHDQEPGFLANCPGLFLGFDTPVNNFCFGGGIGYSYSHLKWNENRGSANIQAVYGAVYGKWAFKNAFLQSSVIGAYDSYDVDRHIEFGTFILIDRNARSKHGGGEGLFNLKGALVFEMGKTIFSPFCALDYMFLHETKFHEKGANSINLHIKDKNSDLLYSEIGFDISHCFSFSNERKIIPFFQLKGIRESRFLGRNERACFESGSCIMDVKGLNPSKSFAGFGAGLNAHFSNSNISIMYQGKYCPSIHDSALFLTYRADF